VKEDNMYDPTLGRFLEEDPILADVNPYRYCRDNPTNRADPTGFNERLLDRVDGHFVIFDVTKGTPPSWIDTWFSEVSPAGTWGQPADRTDGSVKRSPGAVATTVILRGGNVCNTIDKEAFKSIYAGEIRASVSLPPGTYRILWQWEITERGDAQGGLAKVTRYTPNGMEDATGQKPSEAIVLNPGVHEARIERTCVTTTKRETVLIAHYQPSLSRFPLPKERQGEWSSTEGMIKVIQIKKE
jgi:hypothetical protein